VIKIILIGMKGSGKTTIGRLLAQRLHVAFIDADSEIEKMHQREKGEVLPFREIFSTYGATYFQTLDAESLRHIARGQEYTNFVFACGGRTPLQEENQQMLKELGTIIFLNVEKAVLLKHIFAQGTPAFFRYKDDPQRSLEELLQGRQPTYRALADIVIDISEEAPEQVVDSIIAELHIRDED
jgi:shikimate kinase